MKYRSSTEIIDSILHSIEMGSTKTHIMYRAYLSYSQLKEYLKLLQDRDLIRYEEGSQLYHLTEKGLRFINVYEEIKELVPTADEQNNSSLASTEASNTPDMSRSPSSDII